MLPLPLGESWGEGFGKYIRHFDLVKAVRGTVIIPKYDTVKLMISNNMTFPETTIEANP